MSKIVKIAGYGLLGAIALPGLLLPILIGIYVGDGRCGAPGDNGGCETGLAANLMVAVPAGAALGLGFGIWRSARAAR